MRRSTIIVPVLFLGLGLTTVGGCGNKNGLVKVEGIVKLNGEPLEGATVIFVPEDEKTGHPAQGLTDKDGHFVLRTASADGAYRGDYKVVVSKTDSYISGGGDIRQQYQEYRQKTGKKAPKQRVPTVYTNAGTTPLHRKVPPDEDLVLELTGKVPGKK